MKRKRNTVKLITLAICTILIAILFSSVSLSYSISNLVVENNDKLVNDLKLPQEPSKNTGVQLLVSDASGLIITNTLDTDCLLIDTVPVGDRIYYKLTLPGYFFTTEIGKPQIPIKTQLIAIPESVDIDLTILDSTYTTLEGYTVYPVPESVERESSDGCTYCEEVFSINETFYSTDSFYPDTLAEIESISHIRDQRVARLVFHPLRYNPTTQELRVYSSIQVKVGYSQCAELEIKDVGPFDSICSNLVLNYASSKTTSMDQNRDTRQGSVSYPSDLSDPGNVADYLIITSDTFYTPAKQDFDNGTLNNRLNELAHWRASYNGFDVAVVSVSNPFIGGNTDNKIKAFIRHVYNVWSAPHMADGHVGYILLVGDTPDVAAHPDGLGGVSDTWYACIDSDQFPDLMIGRFSVDDNTELNIVANKTIRYEQNPVSGDWHKKVLMCEGSRDFGDNNFLYYNFTKKVLLELGGWEVSEVFMVDGGTSSQIRDNINDGRGIVVYCGHGSPFSWQIFYESDIYSLNNGYKLPLVFSLACSTGQFQFQDGYDCMGETFLNVENKGAVLFWGASRGTSAISLRFSHYVFTPIFENFEYIVGKIITEGIIQFGLWNCQEYILFGDPALDLSGSTGYPDRPDLATSHLNITSNPENPTNEDNEVTISATVLNIGGGTASNVLVRFIVINEDTGDQYPIGEQTVSEILPNGRSECTQLWNISGENGKRSLIVQIDPLNSIDEAFELNNQAGITFTISPPVVYVDINNTGGPWNGTVEHPYRYIQDGINNTTKEGTVIVRPGTYREHVIIDKTITLIGENRDTTIIDGYGVGTVVYISPYVGGYADGIYLSGFTVRNSGPIMGNTGIKVGSNYNTITGNTIENNYFGIYILSNEDGSTISGNTIKNNRGCGVRIYYAYNNKIYLNNFINNANHSFDTGGNAWCNGALHKGNYWDNFDEPSEGAYDNNGDGIIDTPYNIHGGNSKDNYPLATPYRPLPDLIITDFSAEYIVGTSTDISAARSSRTIIKFTATIKNNGDMSITTPFLVSFYGTPIDNTFNSHGIQIGTVTIPLLMAGENSRAVIYWRLRPEMSMISVFADNTRIIEESNENNNHASLFLPSSTLWKSLTKTVDVYRKLSQLYETPSAEKVVNQAESAIRKETYARPREYIKTMKTIAELEFTVGRDLEGQVQPSLLQKYQEIVRQFIMVIDMLMNNLSSHDITWDNAKAVADIQLRVCDVVILLLNRR